MNPVIWQYIGIFSVALAAVILFLAMWGSRERRRERAIQLAAILDAWGFSQFSRLIRAYAIGNYIGANSVARVMREIIDELLGDGLPAMLRKIGWKVVKGVFLNDPTDRAELEKLLADTKPPAVLEPAVTLKDTIVA